MEKAAKHNTTAAYAYRMLPMLYAQAGRVQKAQAMLDHAFKGWPAAMKNVRFYMSFWAFKDLQVMERIAEGYIKAGLPGESSGFYKISKENRLTGKEIRKLFFGRKVTGFTPGTGKQWWIERSKDGKATIRTGKGSDTGKSWIEEDMLCDQMGQFL